MVKQATVNGVGDGADGDAACDDRSEDDQDVNEDSNDDDVLMYECWLTVGPTQFSLLVGMVALEASKGLRFVDR